MSGMNTETLKEYRILGIIPMLIIILPYSPTSLVDCRCGTEEPARKHRVSRNFPGFLSQADENCLSGFLRVVRVAELPEGRVIHQATIALDNDAEGLV